MHDPAGTTQPVTHCFARSLGNMWRMMDELETGIGEHFSHVVEAEGLDDVRAKCADYLEAVGHRLDAMHETATRSACMMRR
jgi:hypothetical protein